MLDLDAVNALDATAFVDHFGDVAEHSPWVAKAAAAARPYPSREQMVQAFRRVLTEAAAPAQLEVLRAHPDLGTRMAVAQDLSGDSGREQAGAGLTRMSREQFDTFTRLNALYRERNGFPFIFAVKGATRQHILDAFRQRLESDAESERRVALENVCRIMQFRIEQRVSE